MADIPKLITELIGLERRVETLVKNIKVEIKKEKNAKKRKKLSKAYKNRNRSALSTLWFKRH